MSATTAAASKYIATLKANGHDTVRFNCPHCQEELETLANNTDQDWDTLSNCPACSGVFDKKTQSYGGEVIATAIDA